MAVRYSAESDWWLNRTVLSQTDGTPGQRWFRLMAVQDSDELDWWMYRTVLSQTDGCTGQRWVRLMVVHCTVYRTVLGQTDGCTGQCWVRLMTVQDSTVSDWSQTRTVLSKSFLIRILIILSFPAKTFTIENVCVQRVAENLRIANSQYFAQSSLFMDKEARWDWMVKIMLVLYIFVMKYLVEMFLFLSFLSTAFVSFWLIINWIGN